MTQQLVSTQQQLSTALDSKRATLSSIKVDEQASSPREAALLQSQSAALEARIRRRRKTSGRSSMAPRHLRVGLDLAGERPDHEPVRAALPAERRLLVPPRRRHRRVSGTPIKAAAAGTVIYAGWMEGYGNLVVIDHGNGLATAYAHQSSIAVGNGASVSQGQVIGYVGCTGYCFGPHLHFEVRVNGEPGRPARLPVGSVSGFTPGRGGKKPTS